MPKTNLKSTKHAVYDINYHIVWCTKFRHEVLTGPVEVAAKQIIGQTCRNYGWLLSEVEIMPDHVHILVSAPPTESPNNIASTLKSISAVHLFTKFHNLKKGKFWGTGLWSSSTFYGTVGNADESIIRNYIQNQKKR